MVSIRTEEKDLATTRNKCLPLCRKRYLSSFDDGAESGLDDAFFPWSDIFFPGRDRSDEEEGDRYWLVTKGCSMKSDPLDLPSSGGEHGWRRGGNQTLGWCSGSVTLLAR